MGQTAHDAIGPDRFAMLTRWDFYWRQAEILQRNPRTFSRRSILRLTPHSRIGNGRFLSGPQPRRLQLAGNEHRTDRLGHQIHEP